MIFIAMALAGAAMLGQAVDNPFGGKPQPEASQHRSSPRHPDVTARTAPSGAGARTSYRHRHTRQRHVARSDAAYIGGGYYTNVNGHSVHRPAHANSGPSGATAKCYDGTWSFSENHRGTCSHHGGVQQWL